MREYLDIYIINIKGINEVKKIFISNNISLFYKYAREYPNLYMNKTLKESDIDIQEDCYELNKEEELLFSANFFCPKISKGGPIWLDHYFML